MRGMSNNELNKSNLQIVHYFYGMVFAGLLYTLIYNNIKF